MQEVTVKLTSSFSLIEFDTVVHFKGRIVRSKSNSIRNLRKNNFEN